MSFLSNAMGTQNNFRAQGIPLQQGATTEQTGQAFTAGQGLAGQNQSVADFLRQYGQNGSPIGYGAANATLGTQGDILSQLVAQGKGQGPNPALEQLKATTAANVNNAAGMAASARGVNPAAAARMATSAAAGANQTAAGQAAIQSASQQLASTQAAAGVGAQMSGLQAQMGQAQAGQQSQNLGLLLQQLGTMGGQNLNQQQILQNALAQYNATNAGQQANINNVNAGVAGQNAQTSGQIAGGILGGAGAALGMFAEGGPVAGGRSDKEVAAEILARRQGKAAPKGKGKRSDKEVAAQLLMHKHFGTQRFDDGGLVLQQPGLGAARPAGPGPASLGVPQLALPAGIPAPMPPMQLSSPALGVGGQPTALQLAGTSSPDWRTAAHAVGAGLSGIGANLGGAGGLGAGFSSGASSLLGRMMHASGGAIRPFLSGGGVSGRARVAGDSESNDTVPALLSPGEEVTKRSVATRPGVRKALEAMNEDPELADYVAHLVSKRKRPGFSKVAEARKRAEG